MHGPISGHGQPGRQPSWWCALSICRCRRPASWGAVGSERSCQLPGQWLRVASIKTCTLWLASNAGPKLKALASSLLVLNLTLLLFTSTLVAAGNHKQQKTCCQWRLGGRNQPPAAVIPTALAKPCSTGCCQIRCGSLNTARNGNTAASENTSAKPLASITSSNKPSWMRLRLLRCCQMP